MWCRLTPPTKGVVEESKTTLFDFAARCPTCSMSMFRHWALFMLFAVCRRTNAEQAEAFNVSITALLNRLHRHHDPMLSGLRHAFCGVVLAAASKKPFPALMETLSFGKAPRHQQTEQSITACPICPVPSRIANNVPYAPSRLG